MNLKYVYKKFIDDRRTYCSIATIDYYKENLQRFFDYIGVDFNTDISFFTADHYRLYITHLNDSDISRVTVSTYVRAIKVFFRWSFENGYMEINISEGIKVPKGDAKIIIPLSIKDVAEIDGYLQYTLYPLRNYIVFHLLLDLGLRTFEVVKLKITDINFAKRFILIKNAKRNKNRILPCPDFLMDKIYEYVADKSFRPNQPLLGVTSNAIKMLFQRIQKNGIYAHAHLCRHTFGTSFAIDSDGNLIMLQLLMGHSDIKTTQKYLHIANFYNWYENEIYKLDPVFYKGIEKGKRIG